MARRSETEHDQLVASLTGGMVPGATTFKGSDRLRPDGRPTPEFRAKLRRIPNLANSLSVAGLLAAPFAIVWAVVTLSHWAAVLAAVPVMGAVQLRMFILQHEAAHRLLFSNRRVNDVIGINLFGWLAFGPGTHTYRRVHTHHHRDEFGPTEPDFLLYSFYPIAPKSLRRKLLRDALGVSAWRIVKPLVTGIARKGKRIMSLRFYLGQLVVLGLFTLSGRPWLYLLLWVLPYAVGYQVLNRLRAIAEHGGMTRSDDRRATTHHVTQGGFSKVWLVPYNVGHHLAHHVDSGVPFRRLPKLTDALIADGYITPEITWPSYWALWRGLVRSKSPADTSTGTDPATTTA